ncbi:hypothetical protein FHR81_002852 [Actinoalloteichus hoggarensis]|uniref:Uncharacterized protein n=1 Tax=Actinoalloteichus hoggarensis TaxID=1470176 RepID=A0A221VY66_9PSEU|nr:DUF4245 domain-containing protein [Actinoalloteichus hoggarensis]ASO18445.1 hypothetical protein AHOG_03945 [Actinoalloteichus hoggarensis]MBB5921812.1 hypothetical protein [Actinoalloteichus hoggarensis]
MTAPKTTPPPLQKPNRASLTGKDMVGSMLILAAIILLGAGLLGRCSFNPTGPDPADIPAPTVDVAAGLGRAVDRVDFPVRQPELPEDWQATTLRVNEIDPAGVQAVRIGWLTSDGSYLRLSQSDADEGTLVAYETRQAAVGQGMVSAAGHDWVHYLGERDETVWVTEVDGSRILLTGTATETDFQVMAEAVVEAEVLPAR